MTDSRIDERTMRRPTWAGGIAIAMADGAAWWLPRPSLRPLISGDGPRYEWLLEKAPAPEIGATIEAVFASIQEGRDDFATATVPLTAVAIMCLQRNYTLRADQAAWLISGGFLERGDLEGWLSVSVAIRNQLVGPVRRDLANVLAGPPRLRLGFDEPFEMAVEWRSSLAELTRG